MLIKAIVCYYARYRPLGWGEDAKEDPQFALAYQLRGASITDGWGNQPRAYAIT
jgi:hypothetical protein